MDNRYELNIKAAGFTDVGPVRGENQDAILLPGLIGLGNEAFIEWEDESVIDAVSVAVIDGMGGYRGGRDAAAFCAAYLSARHLPLSTSEANGMLCDLSQGIAAVGKAFGASQMGAAAAMMTVRTDRAFFANVGDCRIYCISGNSMGQVSVDDRIDEESSGITQAIGPTERPDAHLYSQALRAGEQRFLLCSDGVWSALGNDALKQLAIAKRPLVDVCCEIRERLYKLAAGDNCSLVIVEASLVEQGVHSS